MGSLPSPPHLLLSAHPWASLPPPRVTSPCPFSPFPSYCEVRIPCLRNLGLLPWKQGRIKAGARSSDQAPPLPEVPPQPAPAGPGQPAAGAGGSPVARPGPGTRGSRRGAAARPDLGGERGRRRGPSGGWRSPRAHGVVTCPPWALGTAPRAAATWGRGGTSPAPAPTLQRSARSPAARGS